ncbi:dehydrogenase/reductase SDR family member on chromosome X isoform X1 [Vigna radiata var. radiata]|uniref:Dehydrogenase/reductase SDR family member on chromosome X isoform X1 n=1 Tax=Vigna radiata var. radiata TaxID=3916 RepID=A0A1S3VVL3_VIGRR|nr:dehydrogenase/reductase SDR family member on chromosome X isoform X1 [Vigna radiata var. radiata]
MGLISLVKELLMAFFFVCSVQFWRMALFWSFSVLFSYYRLFKASLSQWLVFKPVILDKCPFFSQKLVSYPRCYPYTSNFRPVCVVTGATSGLGLAAAYKLSKEGYVVAIVGRSQQLLSETIRKIKDSNEDAHLKAFQVDMSSIESIIKFKVSLRQWLLDSDLHCSLQLLINNAGILATSPRVTAEGYDQMIGTNYIGAFALTKLLLPLLESSPVSSKIVNVTSFTHRAVTDVQVDEGTVSGKRFLRSIQYPYAQIYEYSKLYLILFSKELHRQLCLMGKSHQIFVNVADPGVVQTNLMREVPTILSSLALRVLKFLQLLQFPESGVDSIIDAALAPPGTSGAYYFGGKGRTINPSALSHNAKLARELWESTSKLLSVTPFGAEGNSW